MSNVRVGRYLRDNRTGEWCILTRNNHDGIVRLQYMRVTQAGARERIGLTCATRLFDKGLFLESVLFKCHDHEVRVCHRCACTRCLCKTTHQMLPSPRGLAGVAQDVVREGANDWLGTVRVTVVSNISNNPLLNIDDTMTVRSSYQPGLDTELAAQMQQWAIFETVTQAMRIPPRIAEAGAADDVPSCDAPPLHACQFDAECSSNMQCSSALPEAEQPCDGASIATAGAQANAAQQSSPAVSSDLSPIEFVESEPRSPLPTLWSEEMTFGDGEEGIEIADHFLIPTEARFAEWSDEAIEDPIMPADPSTLPGGIDTCLDGRSMDECEEVDDDDCFSLMTSERDTRSVRSLNSALSTAGSDGAPQLDSVPHPGDDVLDAISALNLSSSCSPRGRCSCIGADMKDIKLEDVGFDVDSVFKLNLACCDGNLEGDICGGIETACMSPIDGPLEDAPMAEGVQHEKLDGGVVKTETTITGVDEKCAAAAHHESDEITPVIATTPALTPALTPAAARVQTSATVAPVVVVAGAGGIGTVMATMVAPMVAAGAAAGAAAGTAAMAPCIGTGVAANCGEVMCGGLGVCNAAAPRLAPRPNGMDVQKGMTWGVNGMFGMNQYMMAARMQAMEKERKAEERRKKNRQAAARSNAKKKDLMDGIRKEIRKSRQQAEDLQHVRDRLLRENQTLKVKSEGVKARTNC